MRRHLVEELLDVLPPGDQRARRSRRDLIRVNAWMRHSTILSGVLRTVMVEGKMRSLAELGAGDGEFLLRTLRRLAGGPAPVAIFLVDRLNLVETDTLAQFRALGANAEAVVEEAIDWMEGLGVCPDVIVTNLFLHHLSGGDVRRLMRAMAGKARVFVALEPRRNRWSLLASKLLWLIGCNAVTCHDAPASVRAGFNGGELTAHWPQGSGWQLSEGRAGLFSHLFVARRVE